MELPAGRIESADRDFTLRVERGYTQPQDFAAIPLGKGDDGYVVRLGDVAKVELASAERRQYYRSNGEPNIGLGVVKTSTANSLDVARAVRAELDVIRATLPKGTQMFVAFDNTVFIDAAVNSVYQTLAEAIVLTAEVAFLKAALEIRADMVTTGHAPSAAVPTNDDLRVATERLVEHQLHGEPHSGR